MHPQYICRVIELRNEKENDAWCGVDTQIAIQNVIYWYFIEDITMLMH